nr:MAG TPA: hypothetical protein [Caudoviricetes sp.]
MGGRYRPPAVSNAARHRRQDTSGNHVRLELLLYAKV